MLNSLTILFASILFTLFGYFSVVRILWKQQSDTSLLAALRSPFADVDALILSLGHSALFVSLPAVSLLLYWGWAPALIWLITFHLLAETTINLLVNEQVEDDTSNLLQPEAEPSRLARWSVLACWQTLAIFLLAIVSAQVARLIDQQSGLFWAIVCLVPASTLLLNSNAAIPKTIKQIGAAAVFTFGLVMADTLGLAVYGSWPLVGDIAPWLVLNNTTLFALALTVAGAALFSDVAFPEQLTMLAGYILAALLVALLIGMVWLRPIVDAPILNAQTGTNPAPVFIGFCLLMFGSCLVVLIRLVERTHADGSDPSSTVFGQAQSLSLFQLLFSLVLVICLAAALGIGAWNTHYAEWSFDANLLRHYELALTSLFELAGLQSDTGGIAYTVFLSGICFAGLGFLLVGFRHLRVSPKTNTAPESFQELIGQSVSLQVILIFLATCYFLEAGITLDLWLFVGTLSWFLVSNSISVLAIKIAAKDSRSISDKTMMGFTLLLICLGAIQTLVVCISWLQRGQWLFGILSALLLLVATVLWRGRVSILFRNFNASKEAHLFEPGKNQ